MKNDRRDFIRKSGALAAALSVGGMSVASAGLLPRKKKSMRSRTRQPLSGTAACKCQWPISGESNPAE